MVPKAFEEQFIVSESPTDLLDEGDYLLLRLQRVESADQRRVLLCRYYWLTLRVALVIFASALIPARS